MRRGGSYFAPPEGVATTRNVYVAAKTNVALTDLDRRLRAIVERWSGREFAEVDSARARELFGSVLLQAECQLVDAANIDAGLARPA